MYRLFHNLAPSIEDHGLLADESPCQRVGLKKPCLSGGLLWRPLGKSKKCKPSAKKRGSRQLLFAEHCNSFLESRPDSTTDPTTETGAEVDTAGATETTRLDPYFHQWIQFTAQSRAVKSCLYRICTLNISLAQELFFGHWKKLYKEYYFIRACVTS